MSRLPLPRVVLITGATGAIGQALALRYAAQDSVLLLQGRQSHILHQLADQCRQLGATVEIATIDLQAEAEWLTWLNQQLGSHPVDLCILNAGINCNIGPRGEAEHWSTVAAMLAVNVQSVMATVHAVLPVMRVRGYGQIALMSSLAAWFGLPVTPTYSATKAAIKAYGEGLRGWLATEGIAVNVIMPGYIQSAMCDEMAGPKPFLMQPAEAARRIQAGLRANRARISFPFPLNLGTWLLACMPACFSLWIVRQLGYVRSND